ncbi:MAG: hypothetical protein A2161_20145 [Candidatus Schekmanbacteria bacterium RBG_13_48_7]|uniref:ABC transporter domain-containing protein n=1 Tax=Candidatus Schekmanbacteria bacterium RBG_13_48_7 TaxID=1817878 RepID=A0A1F7S031_9BACT|nr:MAG: hypothetical protein A2161_20145 [Candidatus Schekmanbacteria bacterium RBG_13_48_7]
MIRLDNTYLNLGGQVIFDSVSWQVKDNDRVGLVGPNGAGKTTLLRMIVGKFSPDRGEVIVPKNTTIGYLPQEIILLKGRTVFEEVRTVYSEITQVQDKMHELEQLMAKGNPQSPDYQGLIDEYGHLQEKFNSMDGYQIDAKIGEVLHGLGFSNSDLNRSVEEFSGGWQMRIVLAKLLLSKPSIMLLDEPTNHLDLEARNWLEQYLEGYQGTIILVSHDRYFLDIVTDRITEIEFGAVTDFYSNYSGYLVEKEARYERLEAQVKRQDENIKKTKMFIARNRYDKRRAALVQSRIKMLDKMEIINLPPRPKAIHFQFPDPPRSGRVVIELQNISKLYGSHKVFEGLNLMIERGDRIGLVGPNGAGKSTLMRILANLEKFNSGTRTIGHNVQLRFMDQEVTSTLNINNIVINELQSVAPYDIVPQIRNLLGAFLFSGDDVNKRVSVLSGGEKSRLAIAKMLLEPANVLLLDEPTNHLDIKSQEILLTALKKFSGTIIFVSHERYFINELAEKIIEVQNGHITIYQGNYESYISKKKSDSIKPAPEPVKPDKSILKEVKIQDRAQRKAIARDEKKKQQLLKDLEHAIHQKESQLADIEQVLADPELYKDGQRAKESVELHKNIRQELQNLYDQWIETEHEDAT